MRSRFFFVVTLFVVSSTVTQATITRAQYDFDDFLHAVESGKAKSVAPSRIAPRLAQRTESPLPGPVGVKDNLSDVPSLTESREVPPTSILPTPNPDPMKKPLSLTAPGGDLAPSDPRKTTELQSNQASKIQPDPTPLSMIETPQSQPSAIGSSVVEPPMFDKAPMAGGSSIGQPQSPIPMEDSGSSQDAEFAASFYKPQQGCDCSGAGTSGFSCATCAHPSSSQVSCAVMPYRQPNLPASSSLRGYFNASPCLAHVWDNYACEAAAHCEKLQHNHCFGSCPPVGQVYDCGANCALGCQGKPQSSSCP